MAILLGKAKAGRLAGWLAGWLARWLALVLIDLVRCTYVYIYRLVDNMWCFKKEKSVKEGGKTRV